MIQRTIDRPIRKQCEDRVSSINRNVQLRRRYYNDDENNGDSRGSFRRIGHGASDRHVKQRDHSRLPSARFGRSQVEVGLWRWKSSSGIYDRTSVYNRMACFYKGSNYS